MGLFGQTDKYGRVTMLLSPEEAKALLEHLDLPEEEPEEDSDDRYLKAGEEGSEAYVDKYSLRKRLERAADGHSNPQPAAGSPGTERAAEQFVRGY